MTILEPIDLVVAPPEVPVEPSPMGEPVGRSVASTLSSPTGRVIVYILVFLWTIPTFGVLASSFRSEIDVKTTGWWQIFWKPSLTFSNYTQVLGT
jgi:alpha-glucoside transport system permease protein